MPPCLFRRYYTTVQRITQALQNKNTAKTQAYHSSSCRSPLYSENKNTAQRCFLELLDGLQPCDLLLSRARSANATSECEYYDMPQAYHSSSCRSPLYSKTKTPLSGVFWSYRTDFSRATCCSAERAARTPRANASITICRRHIIRHHAGRRYTLKQKHRSAVFSGATGRT